MGELKFPESIEQELFIKSEYLKRHFEDKADPKTIAWLKEECFAPLTGFLGDTEWKIDIVRECIIKREKERRCEIYKESIRIPFDLAKFTPWADKLLETSGKYKIYAPELLYPLDMEKALHIAKENAPLPKQRPFDDEPDSENIFQEYGYRTRSKTPKSLTIEIDFSGEHASSHLTAQRVFFEVVMFKLTSGILLTDEENEQLAALLSSEKSGKFRSHSFYNRLIGLFAWDMKKKHNLGFKEIRRKLTDNNLYIYDKKFCSTADCMGCYSQENCIKALNVNYRIAANSIKVMAIIPTSSKLDKIHPNPDAPFLERYFKV